MRLTILALLSLALLAPAAAQLAPPSETGIRMGHVHLNVADPEQHRQIWIEHFDAEPLEQEGLTGVKIPGMIVLFREQAPTGNAEGTALDHFGLKVPNRDDLLETWRAAGLEVGRVFNGSEGFPNAYVLGPDGFRMEVQEDATLTRPVAQHLHYFYDQPLELQAWYVDNFGAVAGKRSWHEAADLPGINLTLDPPRRPRNSVPTKGRLIDHIGFEVADIETLGKQLEAKGILLERSPDGASVFVTDPAGVSIELTEGLGQD